MLLRREKNKTNIEEEPKDENSRVTIPTLACFVFHERRETFLACSPIGKTVRSEAYAILN